MSLNKIKTKTDWKHITETEKTKKEIDKLKIHKRESYEEVMQRILKERKDCLVVKDESKWKKQKSILLETRQII